VKDRFNPSQLHGNISSIVFFIFRLSNNS